MKRYLFPATLIFLSNLLCAQNSLEQKSENLKPQLSFSGFVRADAAFDTRLVSDSREGFFLFYPKPVVRDKYGDDVNARAGFNQYATMSRLSGNISGTNVLNAKASAVLEADFTGHSNEDYNGFRLRHAYIKLQWKNAKLLAGQYWTPMDVAEALPRVNSLNTGAPFHSFNRSPQIRFEYRTGNFNWIWAALSQRDLASPGPSGVSQIYLRTAVIPNLHFQLQYKNENVLAGAGIDYKELSPRLLTDSLVKTNEKVRSMAAIAFAKISTNPLDIIVQGVYGQNLFEHLMLGGYAVENTDLPAGKRSYINLNHFYVWTDISTRTHPVKGGIFAGYALNLGTLREATPIFYGRTQNIESIMRISSRVQYSIDAFALMAEAEVTSAAYGIPDEFYKFSTTERVNNLRIQFSVAYNF